MIRSGRREAGGTRNIRRLRFPDIALQTRALPPRAFLPRRELTDHERTAFPSRRDRLFARCTPQEQQLIIAMASWYDANDPQLLARPNLFASASQVMATSKAFPWMRLLPGHERKPPGFSIRALAAVAAWIDRQEAKRSARARQAFIAWIVAAQEEVPADVVFGAVLFLRALPVHVGVGLAGSGSDSPFARELAARTTACMDDTRVSAVRRFAALQRGADWPRDVTGGVDRPRDLGLLAWRLLLALLGEDPAAGVRVVDAHWDRKAPPFLLSTTDLYADAELAERLAVALRPHRPNVASALMGRWLSGGNSQLADLPEGDATRAALERRLASATATLAEWTFTDGLLEPKVAVSALLDLFRFGDPSQDYWRRLPERALALLGQLQPEDPRVEILALMCVVLYAPPEDRLASLAVERLDERAHHLMSDIERVSFSGLSALVNFLDDSVGALESSVIRRRDRDLPSLSGQVVLKSVDARLDDLMTRRMAAHPERALGYRVSLIRNLPHEQMLRKHHRLLREEFRARAQALPQEAGVALQRLIKYCAYSQSDEHVYRRELCAESFELLLPVLEKISPADAAVARKGIGWSLREDGPDFDDD